MAMVIAHRGASAEQPENTLRACDLAIAQGAAMIEVDVQRSADGTLVLFHDETLARFGGPDRPIQQFTLAELRQFPIGGEPIATLSELFDLARSSGVLLNLEIKQFDIAAEVGAAVIAANLVDQVICSSFSEQALVDLRAAAPQIARGYLMGTRSYRPLVRLREAWPFAALRRTACQAWHPSHELPLVVPLIRAVRRAGYHVNLWTIDDPARMRALAAAGAHGIITNHPALAKATLGA